MTEKPTEMPRSQTQLIAGLRVLRAWSRTRQGSIAIASLLTTMLVIVGGVGWLSYSGFCFNQKRFLSEQEYFDAAVSEIIRRNSYVVKTYPPGRVVSAVVPVVKYKDREEFYAANPNCCKLFAHDFGDQGPNPSFSERLFGHAAKIVAVTYRVNYFDGSGLARMELASVQYAVSNCGRAWNARH